MNGRTALPQTTLTIFAILRNKCSAERTDGSSRNQIHKYSVKITAVCLSDYCWIDRTGQKEWCAGYCCDTQIAGWGCCCKGTEDEEIISIGVAAILLWTFGIIMIIIRALMCFFGGGIYDHVKKKIKRRMAKRRRMKEVMHLQEKEEYKRLRRQIYDETGDSPTESERIKALQLLYEMTDESDDMGHEISCLLCGKYRFSFQRD